MEKIYESKNVIVFYDEQKNLFEKEWLEHTENLTEEEFKEEMRIYGDLVLRYKPEKELVDTCKFQFTIAPDVQDWIGENVFPIYPQAGLRWAAFIANPEFITQLSVEQLMESGDGKYLLKHFFDNKEEAREWLDKKSETFQK